jgi:hypothetical protein
MFFKGIPDRLVIGPNQFIAFFELKRIGEEPFPKQDWVHRKLRGFGFTVIVPDTKQNAIDEFERLRKEYAKRVP